MQTERQPNGRRQIYNLVTARPHLALTERALTVQHVLELAAAAAVFALPLFGLAP